MKSFQVSPQRAGAIMRSEFKHRGETPRKVESLILKTGAMLLKMGRQWWVSGYAWDGSDVEPYRGRAA